jgi:hypothetical protein
MMQDIFKALAISLAFGAVAMPAHAQSSPEKISPAIDQCIRSNAASVEVSIADLNQAVDFLVGNLCAVPIADEQAQQTKANTEKQRARWTQACAEEQNSKPTSSDNKTVNAMSLFCSNMKMGFLTQGSDDDTGYIIYNAGAKPPAVVALASQLLLDLRLSHLKSGTAH